ncbi:MAG: hypothetical protein EOM62_19035 [Bacteroidia bacterium]|nr:hypothetical protein [Bacteroidia bacterium]
MELMHFITVSFGEFQVWYNSGELRCNVDRFVAVTIGSDNNPIIDDFVCKRILDRMPHVDMEEEHSVVLVRVNFFERSLPQGRTTFGIVETALDMIYLPCSAICSLHPLTQRAGRILSSRLEEYNVRIEQPLFEDAVEALWREWSLRRALSGGETLLKLLIFGSTFVPSPALLADARASLCEMNMQNMFPLLSKGLVINVFCYDRHDPLANSDVGYLQDLAVILKKRYGDNIQGTQHQCALRELCTSDDLKQMSIADIISCDRVVSVLAGYEPLTGSSANLQSLVLFLRWKYTSQRKGSVVLKELLENVRECAEKIARDIIEQAVWLFGYYCGFDKLAGEYYARTPDRHAFVNRQIPHNPCSCDLSRQVAKSTEPPIAIEKVKKARKPKQPRKKVDSEDQPQLQDQPLSTQETSEVRPTEKG